MGSRVRVEKEQRKEEDESPKEEKRKVFTAVLGRWKNTWIFSHQNTKQWY